MTYSASAVDDVDGPVPVSCSPASGATFPIGTTTVVCTARDAAGNAAAGSFRVTVRGALDQIAALRAEVALLPAQNLSHEPRHEAPGRCHSDLERSASARLREAERLHQPGPHEFWQEDPNGDRKQVDRGRHAHTRRHQLLAHLWPSSAGRRPRTSRR